MFLLMKEDKKTITIGGNIAHIYFSDGVYFDSLKCLYENIKTAEADENIDVIILYVDTYGGEAQATFKFLTDLKNIKTKKLITNISTNVYSAGVLLYSIGDEVIMHPEIQTGSIGAITQRVIENDKTPYTIKTFKSAEFKNYEDNDAQNEYLQSHSKLLGDKFITTLVENRQGKCTIEGLKSTEAKTFDADTALKLGLVDKLMTTNEFENYITSLQTVSMPEGIEFNDDYVNTNTHHEGVQMSVENPVPQAVVSSAMSSDNTVVLDKIASLEASQKVILENARLDKIEALSTLLASAGMNATNVNVIAEALVVSNPNATVKELVNLVGVSVAKATEPEVVTAVATQPVTISNTNEALMAALTTQVGSNDVVDDKKTFTPLQASFLTGKCLHIKGVI